MKCVAVFILATTLSMTARLAVAVEAPGRFIAVYDDGRRITGDEVRQWADDPPAPTLAGQPLLSDDAVRWLRDQALPAPPTPPAYIELVGGDRLPGRVVGFRPASDDSDGALPAHLLVEPELLSRALATATTAARTYLRVDPREVRRIVWQSSSDGYHPGAAYLRDGTRVRFRSLRWSESAVRLLVDDGAQEIPLDRLAAIHLPEADPWEAYFRHLARLSPDGQGRLVWLETSDGLRATASTQRCRVRASGATDQPDQWIAELQPAWCLDAIELRYRQIRTWQFFLPHEVPLTRIAPAADRRDERAVRRSAALDRNAEGDPLRAADLDYAWGWGVHAFHELSFPLSAAVRSVRTRVALDQLAGDGGCARGRILLGSKRGEVVAESAKSPHEDLRLLYESPHLVGSRQVCDSGWLPLGDFASGEERLVLLADSAHHDRPAGADPLDIRDFVDWLEPQLRLDPAMLTDEVRRRLPASIAAWQGWDTELPPAAAPVVAQRRQNAAPGSEYILNARAEARAPLKLSRHVSIGPTNDCLVLAVERSPADSSPAQIEVFVDGRRVAQYDVPAVSDPAARPTPLVVYLKSYRGRDVLIEIVQSGGDDRAWVAWRGLSLVPRPTRIYRWFEDDERLAADLSGEAPLRLSRDSPYSGASALALDHGERANPRLPRMRIPIRYQPGPGEYRFLRFAYRKRGGGRVGFQLAHDERFGPDAPKARSFRYDAGLGPPCFGDAVRIHQAALAGQWLVATRDLYADFGDFDLTGLGLLSLDGGEAQFDHIYLARTLDDFRWVDDELAAESTARRLARLRRYLPMQTTNPRQIEKAVAAFAPGFRLFAADGAQVALMDEYRGESGVLRTPLASSGDPYRLSATVDLPWGRATQLRVRLATDAPQTWRLVIKCNGTVVHNAEVHASEMSGWTDFAIDLSRFAGDKFGAALELEMHASPGQAANAYWSQLDLIRR
ncbi:MAG TPA: hypothetical protein VJ783_18300 [Pirellulales bacterium]|nr:hypothetical protein [Pirellulales bacterium]